MSSPRHLERELSSGPHKWGSECLNGSGHENSEHSTKQNCLPKENRENYLGGFPLLPQLATLVYAGKSQYFISKVSFEFRKWRKVLIFGYVQCTGNMVIRIRGSKKGLTCNDSPQCWALSFNLPLQALSSLETFIIICMGWCLTPAGECTHVHHCWGSHRLSFTPSSWADWPMESPYPSHRQGSFRPRQKLAILLLAVFLVWFHLS